MAAEQWQAGVRAAEQCQAGVSLALYFTQLGRAVLATQHWQSGPRRRGGNRLPAAAAVGV